MIDCFALAGCVAQGPPTRNESSGDPLGPLAESVSQFAAQIIDGRIVRIDPYTTIQADRLIVPAENQTDRQPVTIRLVQRSEHLLGIDGSSFVVSQRTDREKHWGEYSKRQWIS